MWIRLAMVVMGLGIASCVCLADPPDPGCRSWLPWLALPSDTGNFIGYHVGGGCNHPHKAEPRHDEEGTWGWDYQGWLPRQINLGWWHGRRNQGGTGSYKADGPLLYHHEE